tara:strand:+ start:194 stop:508 length:315 start_codon:yes stop_codon:yes gene_type:complete
MNIEKLKNLQSDIDKLDKIHHLKILKILRNNDVKYSENRNGIFVNMNGFNQQTITDIETTLKYINEQEKQLKDVETIKADLEQDFFIKNKQVKENTSINLNEFA